MKCESAMFLPATTKSYKNIIYHQLTQKPK